MKHVRILFLVIAAMLFSQKAMAQCTFRNTAFKSGEFLTYNLYYNWKFVWVKVEQLLCTPYRANATARKLIVRALSLVATTRLTIGLYCATHSFATTHSTLLPSTSARELARATDTQSMRFSTTIQMAKST